ncbi:MAG: phospholipid carrier-dependent glycosyltransferase [Candidatus Dormibacteraeota bacterium]|nr:phospholipid carrier-dependent glycosyltransferase [Candidatus Dormibacteraeota bacterium]
MLRPPPAAAPTTAETGEGAEGSGDQPLVRAGLRGFLDLDRFDVIAIVVLVVAAFVVRVASPIFPDFLSGNGGIGAFGVGYPYNASECALVPVGQNYAEVNHCGYVFDEIYFPVDASKDLAQPAVSYFDPEPPLAKILMAPPIAWWGFDTWTWRASTILFGSLLVGVIYLIARRLRRDRFFALAAGILMSFDGLAFVESRTGVIDIIAIFFVALFYYVFLLHWQARTKTQWRRTLYVMAVVAGLAFGAKLTALAPLVVAAALILFRGLAPYLATGIPFLRRLAGPRRIETVMWRDAAGTTAILQYIAAGVLMVCVFFACYSRYLTIEHDDVYMFTSCNPASAGLVGSAVKPPLTPPVAHVGSVAVPNPAQAIYNIYEINAASIKYHELECHSHPYSSHWYTWPVMEHPVLFYYDSGTAPTNDVSSITDMGNPAVWWLAIPALLFCVWRMTRGPPWWRVGLGALGIVSLLAMVFLFEAAQRYHDPSNYNTSYTAAQFVARFHMDPSPQYEISRINPSGWFDVAFAGMILFAAGGVISAVVSRAFVPAFIVLGYVTAWMMWVSGNEARVLFFYHALGMLIFSVLALAYALTAIRRVSIPVGRWTLSLAPVAFAALVLVLIAFIFFYPVWTAAPLSLADHQMRIWVDTW